MAPWTGEAQDLPSVVKRAAVRVNLQPCTWSSKAHPAYCGEFEVFENRALRTDRKLRLPLIILPAQGKATLDPVVFLAGGPGQAATDTAQGMSKGGLQDLRATRDFVFVDRRGTGKNSLLPCDLTGGVPGPAPFAGDLFPVKILKECAQTWNADPRQYTTAIAVEDLEEMRQALGYEKLNLYGISYGTLHAQVFARRFPASVRTMLLDTVAAPRIDPLHYARGAQRSLDRMFAECEALPDCRSAFPKLRAEFAAVLARLAKAPAKTKVTRMGGGEILFTRELLGTTIRSMLYFTERRRRLPWLIHEAFLGRFSDLGDMAVGIRRSHLDDLSLYLAVMCAESVRTAPPDVVARETAGTFLGDYWYRQISGGCGVVPHAVEPPSVRERVKSAAPTLLLSGFHDPITPPEMAQDVAAGLPQGKLVVIPTRSHSLSGPDYSCADPVISQFILRGTTKGLDTSCLERLPAVPFATSKP